MTRGAGLQPARIVEQLMGRLKTCTTANSPIVDFARSAWAAATDWKSVVQRFVTRGAGLQPARMHYELLGRLKTYHTTN